MDKKIKSAQSIVEYVAIVIIVSIALSGVVFYISRVIEIRVRHLNQELNEATRGKGLI